MTPEDKNTGTGIDSVLTNGVNGKPVLLIVDDDEENRLNLGAILQNQYHIHMAVNGEEAWNWLQEYLPNIILSDIQMPGMDGLELLRKIREDYRLNSIPVVLLSAEGEEAGKKAMNLGASSFLSKPFKARELVAELSRFMSPNDTSKTDNTRHQVLNKDSSRKVAEALYEWDLMKLLPVAVYTCDTNGCILQYNEAAAELWGRRPEIGKDLWCGSWKIFSPEDGHQMQLDECPMAITLKEQRPVVGEQIIVERPDGTRRFVQPFPRPIFSADGEFIGAINTLMDQTDARNREGQLSMLAAIVRSSDDAIISKTLDGIVTSWNRAAERIFGYSAEEMIGSHISKIIPEDRLQEETTILNKLRKGESLDHFETVRVTRDRRFLDISLTVSPLRDGRGNIIGVSKISRDITRQKQLERIIRASEERFRMVADSAPVMIWMSDKTKGCTYFNKGWFDFTGNKLDDNLGFGWTSLIHPDDKSLCIETYSYHFDNQSDFRLETRFRRHDGLYRWLSVYAKPYYDFDGSFLGYIGACVDIQEQKAINQELERRVSQRTAELMEKNRLLVTQKNFLESILDSTMDLITVFDRDLNYVALNKRGFETYNISDDIIGKNLLDLYPELKGTSFHTNLEKAFRGTFVHDQAYYSIIVNRSYEMFFIPLAEEGEVPNEVLVIGHDISDVLNASLKLQEGNELLERKNRELQQINAELASFSYVASHDLQEPLRKIKIFGKMLVENEGSNLTKEGGDYLDRMIKASDRMQNLIDALLEFSRTNTSERVFENRDLNELVSEVERELRERLEERNGKIVSENLPELKIIPFQFRQLLFNVIANSLKYAREGVAPEIHISSQQVAGESVAHYEARKGVNYLMISISDNGIGFEQQYAERVFELFQRLHGRNEYSGSGIGLAICKKIANNHQGFIRASSTPGVGTTMNIYIPLEIN